MVWYRDFEELRENEPGVAAELLEYLGEGDWQDDWLGVFDSYADLGEYELYEGWLADSLKTQVGDINISTYVDCDWLGRDLVASGGYVALDEKFVYSGCGW